MYPILKKLTNNNYRNQQKTKVVPNYLKPNKIKIWQRSFEILRFDLAMWHLLDRSMGRCRAETLLMASGIFCSDKKNSFGIFFSLCIEANPSRMRASKNAFFSLFLSKRNLCLFN